MEFTIRAIGMIHSPFTKKEKTPIQPSRSKAIGKVEVFPQFVEGLQDIEGFSHLILLYMFHLSTEYKMLIRPYLDDIEHGVFATRYPNRPNPIGLSIVQLVSRYENYLEVKGIDVLDGTPLVDIKPYLPKFDIRENVRAGWFDSRYLA